MKKNVEVVGAVLMEKDKVLCAKRGEEKTLPGKWEFPGGKIEEGESPQEALQREIKEEMNCDIKVEKFITKTVYEYEFAIVHLATYICRIESGSPESSEHSELIWLPAEDLEALDWAGADLPTIARISEDSGWGD
jgi:8-oxo-dGTP diphosphatase